MKRRYGIIIPACNEAEALPLVLAELRALGVFEDQLVAVGVNASTDDTAAIARRHGAIVGETDLRGYGHGCRSAIEALQKMAPVESYIFFAADGANDPRDLARLIALHERGFDVVLGQRTLRRANWRIMGWHHVLANLLLGGWVSVLTGKRFADIGPLRLIRREIFEAMGLREHQYGWTIEAQIRACHLGASIAKLPVAERRRVAGRQKVSRVSWRHSLRVGLEIFRAGWRTARRCQERPRGAFQSEALAGAGSGAAGTACKS